MSFYEKIQDKYYAFMDWLAAHKLPVYKFMDALEDRNIPSFPVFILLLILIIAGLGFGIMTLLTPTTVDVSFNVTDKDGIKLEKAMVSVSGVEFSQTLFTDEDGFVVMQLPKGKELKIIVSKNGYEAVTLEKQVFEEETELDFELEKKITYLAPKSISFFETDGELITETLPVQFSCSNSEAGYSFTEIAKDGSVEVKDVPSNCGSLILEFAQGYTAKDPEIDLSLASPVVYLEKEETGGEGTVYYNITNAAGEGIFGVTVTLYSAKDLVEQIDESPQSGSGVFEKVPTGTYYLVVSGNGEYEDVITEKKTLKNGESIFFDIEMEESVAGNIKIELKDTDTGTAVANAQVKLINNGLVVQTKYSDEAGQVNFSVPVNTAYDIEVDHPAYLLLSKKGVYPQEAFYTYFLEALTANNAQSIVVSIIDQHGKPVDGVKVKLRLSDATPVGDELVTGSDGKVEFLNVNPGEYYVYAVKEGFDDEYSETFTLSPKQIIEKEIKLNIGMGTIIVNVVDEENNPVHGAAVKALNVYQNEFLEEKSTDAEGAASFSIRADKKVFFVVTHSNYLPYVSIPVIPSTSESKKITLSLAKDVSQVSVKFLGLKQGDDTVFNSLDAGKIYSGKIQVIVPAAKSYDIIGLHLRLGKEEAEEMNLMEEDIAVIKNVFSSATKTKKGTTYTPLTGMSTDLAHLTGGNAKWVNAEWITSAGKLPSSGVFELAFEIEVKGEAEQGNVLNLFYRGYAIKGSTFERDPVDEILGSNEAVTSKQSLYAETKAAPYSIGPSNLCNEGFCKQLVIEDLGAGIKTSIVNAYTAKINGEYELSFMITQQSAKSNPQAELIVKNESNGIKLKTYMVKNAAGKENAGNAEGFELRESLGNLQEGSQVSGKVRFETLKEGVNDLTISIISAKQEVFKQTIQLQVEPSKEMLIEVLPKVIIPYIDNKLLIKVTDAEGIGIANATVNVSVNEDIIASGVTTFEGVLPLELESPALGDVIKIQAKKNDYKTAEKELKVTEELANIFPPEIKIDLMPVTGTEQEQTIVFTNLTTLALKIEKIALSAEFKKLVTLKGEESFKNMVLDLNKDVNGVLKIALTEEGALVTEPTTIEGALQIYLTNDEVKKRWMMSIPTTVRILLGGETDKKDCLYLLDSEGKALKPWEIITSKEPITLKAKLKNDCTVNNIEIPLNDLEIKVDFGGDNPLGEFRIESQEFEGGMVPLTEEAKLLKKQIKAEAEINFLLKFYPNTEIKSENSDPSIEFKASHLTQTGIEEIKTRLNTRITLAHLEDCISLVSVGLPGEYNENELGKKIIDLTLYTCMQNTGWGNYPNYFGNGLEYIGGYRGPWNGYVGPLAGYAMGPNLYNSGFGVTGTGINPMLANQYGLYSEDYVDPYGTSIPGTGGNVHVGGYKYNTGLNNGIYANPIYGSVYSSYPNMAYYNGWIGGNYGINNFNWLCEQNADQGKFKIVNSCAVPVEIKLDETAQVKVQKKNKFIVNPKEEIDVTLNPGIFSGRYPLKVNARIANTENNFSEIGTVYATIIRPGEILMKCRPILSPTTFQVPIIGWLETEGKIYNYCPHMGYRLLPFGAQNIACYTPKMTPTMPGQVLGPFGSCPLISYVRSSPPKLIFQPNGQAIEVIEFGLRYNPDIVEQWPGFVEGTMNEQVGNLRIALGRLAHTVIAPGKAVVQYTMPFSYQPIAEVFDIILMDPIAGIAGAFDVLMKKGSPDLEPYECIRNKDTYFDLVERASGKDPKNYYPTDEWLGDEYFDQKNGTLAVFAWENKLQWVMKIPRNRQDVIGTVVVDPDTKTKTYKHGDYCGEADSITKICGPIIDKKSGVVIRMVGTEGGHNIAMEVDRSGMTKQCAKIETKCNINVTRVHYHAGTNTVPMKIRVWLLNKGLTKEDVDLKKCTEIDYTPPKAEVTPTKPEEEPESKAKPEEEPESKAKPEEEPESKAKPEEEPESKAKTKGIEIEGKTGLFCFGQKGAVTGKGAYKKLGFDKYLLRWKYDDITAHTCEEYFCDATQFTAYETRRINEIENTLKTFDSDHVKNICSVIDCGKITSLKKLYPISKETRIVIDQSMDKKQLLFVRKDGKLMEMNPTEDCKAAGKLNNKITDIIANYVSQGYNELNGLLNEIRAELKNCYKGTDENNVIAIVQEDIAGEIAELFKKQVFDKVPEEGYVLTFNEYIKMHEGLMTQSETAPKTENLGNCKTNDTCNVQIGNVQIGGNSAAWINFLQEMLSKATWKVVYVYKDGMTEDMEEFIRNNAEDKYDGVSVESKKVYLIGDAFTDDFKADFVEEYFEGFQTNNERRNTNIKEWTFKQLQVDKKTEGLKKETEDNEHNKIDAGKNSGEYLARLDVAIEVNNSTGKIKVTDTNNTTVEFGLLYTLSELDEMRKTDYEKNTFLKIPFEGSLGTKEKQGVEKTRKGYGTVFKAVDLAWPKPKGYEPCWEGKCEYVDNEKPDADPYCVKTKTTFSSIIGNIPLLSIFGNKCDEFELKSEGEECETPEGKGKCNNEGKCIIDIKAAQKYRKKEKLILYNYWDDSGKGFKLSEKLYELQDAKLKLYTDVETKFKELQDGDIISLGLNNKRLKGTLKYNAGYPSGLQLNTIENTTVYYRFTNSGDKPWSREDYGYDKRNAYNLMKWLKSDKKTFVNDLLNEFKSPNYCSEWKGKQLVAKLETGSESTMDTVAVVPASQYDSKMQIFCANNEITMKTKSWKSGITTETETTKGTAGGAITLVPQGQDRQILGLENYINMIKTEEVCVETIRDELTADEEMDEIKLIWNAEKFLVGK